MAGLIKSNVQLGDSATATQNFTLAVPATPDGTAKLARGNAGATTQDILTVDAGGYIKTPQNAIYASIYKTSITSAPVTMTVVTDMTTDFSSNVTIANGRITVPVSGIYQVNYGASFDSTSDSQVGSLFVNGAAYSYIGGSVASGFSNKTTGSQLISLAANGYVELAAQRGSTVCNLNAGKSTYLSIVLVAKT